MATCWKDGRRYRGDGVRIRGLDRLVVQRPCPPSHGRARRRFGDCRHRGPASARDLSMRDRRQPSPPRSIAYGERRCDARIAVCHVSVQRRPETSRSVQVLRWGVCWGDEFIWLGSDSPIKELVTIGGGWGGIRTPGEREPTPVFKTGALNHSATHPRLCQFTHSTVLETAEVQNGPRSYSLPEPATSARGRPRVEAGLMLCQHASSATEPLRGGNRRCPTGASSQPPDYCASGRNFRSLFRAGNLSIACGCVQEKVGSVNQLPKSSPRATACHCWAEA